MEYNTVSTVGIDIAKHCIQVHGATKTGKTLFRKRLNRSEFELFMSQIKPSLVGMEACSGAHYWGRQLQAIGHTVKLMPPQYVKPYVKTNKNDPADAEACAEAVTRPTMRFVAVKTQAEQEIMQVHRVRERLVKSRTALCNEIRGFFTEWGIVFPQGISTLKSRVEKALVEEAAKISTLGRELIGRLLKEFINLQEEIAYYDNKIVQIHEAHPVSQRLASIPGIGPITATALIAVVGDANRFKNGRELSAYFGLVPQQNSTGGKPRLGKISKRGNEYMRKLLVQGAHSVLQQVSKHEDARSKWLKELLARKGRCKTVIALANKNARVVWALLTKDDHFHFNYKLRDKQAAALKLESKTLQ